MSASRHDVHVVLVIAPHVESASCACSASAAATMPQLPTCDHSRERPAGYDHEQWYALFAPARTPGPLVQVLHREVTRM